MSLRRVIQIGVGLVLIGVVMGVGLRLYFTSGRLKALILPVISETLNRPVDLRDVQLGFWGGLHASVSGLRVSDRAGFGSDPFIQVEEGAFFLNFWPLLRGDVLISEVTFRGPRISVVMSEQGQANYADLIEAEESPKEEPASESRVTLPVLIIEKGAFYYVDRRDGFVLQIEGLDYRLDIAKKGLETTLNGDLLVQRLAWGKQGQADSLNTGSLRVMHRVRLADKTVYADAIEVAFGPVGITASGKVMVQDDGTNFDLRIDEPGLDLSEASSFLGSQIEGMHIGGTAAISASVTGLLKTVEPVRYPDIVAQIRLSQVAISGEALPGPVAVEAAVIVFEKGSLHLQSLVAKTMGASIQASGQVDGLWPPGPGVPNPARLAVQIEVPHLKDAIVGFLPKGYETDGKLSASIQALGTLDHFAPVLNPQAYQVTGNISLVNGTASMPDLRVPVERMEWSVALQAQDVMQIKQVSVRAGRSDVKVTGRGKGFVDWLVLGNGRPFVDLNVQSRMLDLDDLFPDPATLPPVEDATSGLLLAMRMMDGHVDLDIETMVSDSIPYGNVNGAMVMKNRILQVDSLRATVLGGSLTAQAQIDGRPDHGLFPVLASASLSRIETAQLLKDFMGWPIPLFGQMGTALKLNGHMDSTLTLVNHTMVADGEARLDDGHVVNWPWLQTASGFVPHVQFLNFSDLPLRSLVAPFKIENGRVFLNKMGFSSGESAFQVAGSVGMDGTLDVAVNADLPAARLNVAQLGLDRIPGLNVKPDARIPLLVHIGGTASKPKIETRVQADIQKKISGVVDSLKVKVKDKATDKAKGLIKSLF